jgi:hypothetical protein
MRFIVVSVDRLLGNEAVVLRSARLWLDSAKLIRA